MVGNEGKWNDVTCNDVSTPTAVLCERVTTPNTQSYREGINLKGKKCIKLQYYAATHLITRYVQGKKGFLENLKLIKLFNVGYL